MGDSARFGNYKHLEAKNENLQLLRKGRQRSSETDKFFSVEFFAQPGNDHTIGRGSVDEFITPDIDAYMVNRFRSDPEKYKISRLFFRLGDLDASIIQRFGVSGNPI